MKPSKIIASVKDALATVNIKQTAGFAIFFIATLLVFTYVRFPSEALTGMIAGYTDGLPVKVTTGAATLTFPPGVTVDDIRVTEKDGGAELAFARSVTVHPSIWALIRGEIGGKAFAKILGGNVTASGETSSGGANADVSFYFDKIDPGMSPLWDRFPWGKAKGRVEGEGAVKSINGDVMKSEGWMKAKLTHGSFVLGKFLTMKDLSEIPFDSGDLDVTFKNGKLVVNRLELKGAQLSADVSGDIMAAPNPVFSRLNLKITLKPAPELATKLGPFASIFPKESSGAIVIKLGGTLQTPVVKP